MPDELYAQLLRVSESSNVSAAATVRVVLSDLLPRLTSVLDHLGTLTPEQIPGEVQQLDAWSNSLRDLLHQAPDSIGDFRTVLDPGDEK